MTKLTPIFLQLSDKKHLAFLISLLIFLFGDLLVPLSKQETFRAIFLIQNVWAGLFLVYEKKNWRIFILILLPLMIFVEVFSIFREDPQIRQMMAPLYISYFLAISVELFRQMYSAKEIDLDMISAVLAGFIMLCMIGSFLFLAIEFSAPGSIKGAGGIPEIYTNLNYFSFITTLSIGYGDMVPVSYHAKKAVMLIGLCGHFYSLFVVGIVIGKYLGK